jgi:hypothetical protein
VVPDVEEGGAGHRHGGTDRVHGRDREDGPDGVLQAGQQGTPRQTEVVPAQPGPPAEQYQPQRDQWTGHQPGVRGPVLVGDVDRGEDHEYGAEDEAQPSARRVTGRVARDWPASGHAIWHSRRRVPGPV